MMPVWIFTAGIFAASLHAAAETQDMAADSTTAKTEQLDKVTVTAKKRSVERRTISLFDGLEKREVPFSMTTVTSDLIRDQMSASVTDALRTEPSITNTYGGGGAYHNESFVLRGFAMDGGGDTFLQDGMKTGGQVITSVEGLDGIEVLKGATAFRNGFIGPGGVLNLVTKRPTENPYGSITTSLNQWGNVILHGDVGGRFDDGKKLGYRVNYLRELRENFVDDFSGRRFFLSGAVDYRFTPDDVVTFQYDRTEIDFYGGSFHYLGLLPSGEIPVGPTAHWGQAWERSHHANQHSSMTFESRLADSATFKSTTSYYLSENKPSNITQIKGYSSFPNPAFQANGDFIVNEIRGRNEGHVLGNQTTLRAGAVTGPLGHRLTLSASAYRKDFHSAFPSINKDIGTSNIYDPVFLAPDTGKIGDLKRSQSAIEAGAFLGDYVTVAERWHLLIGGRYSILHQENFNLANGARTRNFNQNAFSPAIAAVADVMQGVSVYSSYSEALQPGGVAPVTASNAGEQLDPVESWQVEAGFKSELLGKKLNLDAALFHINKTAQGLGADGRFYAGGKQEHKGVEARLIANPQRDLTVILGGQYLHARLNHTGKDTASEGDKPWGVPAVQGNLTVDYGLPFAKGLSVNGSATYVGEREYNVPNWPINYPYYTRLDLGVKHAVRLQAVNITTRLAVENVADEEYAAAVFFGSIEYGAPRTLKGSLQLEY